MCNLSLLWYNNNKISATECLCKDYKTLEHHEQQNHFCLFVFGPFFPPFFFKGVAYNTVSNTGRSFWGKWNWNRPPNPSWLWRNCSHVKIVSHPLQADPDTQYRLPLCKIQACFWHWNQHVVCILDMWDKGQHRPPGLTDWLTDWLVHAAENRLKHQEGRIFPQTINHPDGSNGFYLIALFSCNLWLTLIFVTWIMIRKHSDLTAHGHSCSGASFKIIWGRDLFSSTVINKWKVFDSKGLVPLRCGTDLHTGVFFSDSSLLLVGAQCPSERRGSGNWCAPLSWGEHVLQSPKWWCLFWMEKLQQLTCFKAHSEKFPTKMAHITEPWSVTCCRAFLLDRHGKFICEAHFIHNCNSKIVAMDESSVVCEASLWLSVVKVKYLRSLMRWLTGNTLAVMCLAPFLLEKNKADHCLLCLESCDIIHGPMCQLERKHGE